MSAAERTPYAPDNKERRPLDFYLPRYAALDPAEVCARCAVRYDGGGFLLRFLGGGVRAAFPDFEVTAAEPGRCAALEYAPARLLLLRYLLEGRFEPGCGRFLTYREVPWGEAYWKAFEGRDIKRLAYSFANDRAGFERAVAALGGRPAGAGDFSGDIELLDGLVMRLILWAADDEFPPSAQILFSDNFPLAFTAEDMAVAADAVIGELKARSRA